MKVTFIYKSTKRPMFNFFDESRKSRRAKRARGPRENSFFKGRRGHCFSNKQTIKILIYASIVGFITYERGVQHSPAENGDMPRRELDVIDYPVEEIEPDRHVVRSESGHRN
jgi:hypothetical protein